MKNSTTWNLKPLFASDDDPAILKERREREKDSYAFINKWKSRTDYLENPTVLKEALDEYDQWEKLYSSGGTEEYYFSLRTSQNQNNPNLKAKDKQAEEVAKKISNDIQFFELRLAKVSPQKQTEFLQSPELNPYKHFLERLFAESKYLLSEEAEKILNLKSGVAYANWVKLTSGFLAKEEQEVLTEKGKEVKNFSEILNLMSNPDKKIRDRAAKAFNDILAKHLEVAEAEINSVLENKKIDDDLRGVSRPDLTRHLHDDIDTEVVDTVVKTVVNRFDLSRRYYHLKAQLLGVKKLAYHERNVEYGKIEKKYSYPEAIALVQKVFSRLDQEFGNIADGFVTHEQVDAFPYKGKRGGAFCTYGLIINPTYILLNFTPELIEVLTIAHEFGHGINNELIRKKQNALNFGTPISTAEVASTFMEDFVLEELRRQADDELKLALSVMELDRTVGTIPRQIAAYQFEQQLHAEYRQKGYLSKEEIGKIFQHHMSAYMGEYVEQSPGSENWWEYWSHIRTFFYVYSYASGLLISKSLQAKVKKDPQFIEKVKEFLSAGLSDSPKNIFGKLGIDITDQGFWNQGLDEVEKLLEETEKLARKLGKIK